MGNIEQPPEKKPGCKYIMDVPLSIGRKEHLRTTLNKLRTFNPDTTFETLNVQYLTDFQNYCTCCMMAVINFCLNGIIGKVAWMDSLSNRFYGAWQINIHPVHNIPFIREIEIEESRIVLKLKEQVPVLVPELPAPLELVPVQGSFCDDWNF